MPTPKTFRHPTDARHEERIAALIGERGPAGYGIYWMVLEMLYSRDSMSIEYNKKMIRRMAAQTGWKFDQFDQLLDDLIDVYELFAIEEGYLISTLVYRKPRKPRLAARNDENISVPLETGNDSTAPVTHLQDDSYTTAQHHQESNTATPQRHPYDSNNSSITAAKTTIKQSTKNHHPASQPVLRSG